MVARWLVVAVVLSTSAQAEELITEVETSHPRFFAGGYSTGAFIGPGMFSAGPLGIALDMGMQFNRSISASLQLRAATFFIAHQFQVTPSVEWSIGRFSAAAGFGAVVLLTSALPGWELRPAIAVPLGVGLTLGDIVSSRTLGVRINLEFAFLLAPAPWSVGGTAGISVGMLSR
jgi:hypothetical protein